LFSPWSGAFTEDKNYSKKITVLSSRRGVFFAPSAKKRQQ
jgi:hypothetical protein